MSITSFLPSKLGLYVAGVGALAAAAIFAAVVANAEQGPQITTTIRNQSDATLLQAPLSTVVHASAIVATTTSSTTPTGTVDFNLYQNTSCSGTAQVQAGVALVAGVANSATTSVGAAGLSYKVRYNGDADNAPSEGSCASLVASAPNPTLTTALSTSTVLAGSSVHDSATLSNVTANATGTVTYTVYTNSACSLGAQSAGAKTVSSGSVPNSDSITFNTPGTYFWQAVYSGDQVNGAATSTCTSEVLQVLATSTPPGDDDDDNGDGDDHDGDNGKHKGFVLGLPFGILKKVLNDLPIPSGIQKRFMDNDSFEDLLDDEVNIEADAKLKVNHSNEGKGERGQRGERGNRN